MSSNSTQVWKLIQKYANLGIQGGAFNSIEDTQSIRDTIELLKTGVINQVAKQTIEKMFNSLLKAGIITSCAEAKNIVSLNCSIQKYTPPIPQTHPGSPISIPISPIALPTVSSVASSEVDK
jgi:hypothetical protein